MTTKGLVEAAQRGDPGAMSALVDEFAPTVLGAAYGHCADWHLAGDVAQEAFATVVTRLADVRDPAAFPGWLMAVVRTAASRAQRRVVPVASAVERPSDDPGPEGIVVHDDEVRRVRLAVEALPAHLRLPVVLHYIAGSSVAEIADLCAVPVSTVKQRMRVARARLRDGMDEMADDTLCRLRPTPDDDPTDVIRMYTAMRSGDVARVAALLDARPDLVDVREDWTREDSFAHRLPFVSRGGGTPLLRAIERGDDAMVALLLDRGADPNGACTCEAGESPLFTAVSHHRVATVRLLPHRRRRRARRTSRQWPSTSTGRAASCGRRSGPSARGAASPTTRAGRSRTKPASRPTRSMATWRSRSSSPSRSSQNRESGFRCTSFDRRFDLCLRADPHPQRRQHRACEHRRDRQQ